MSSSSSAVNVAVASKKAPVTSPRPFYENMAPAAHQKAGGGTENVPPEQSRPLQATVVALQRNFDPVT